MKATALEMGGVCEEAALPIEKGECRSVGCHHWQPKKVDKNHLNQLVIDFYFCVAIMDFKVEIREMFQPSFTALGAALKTQV